MSQPGQARIDLERLLQELTDAADAQLEKMTPEERERALAEIERIANRVPESGETRK